MNIRPIALVGVASAPAREIGRRRWVTPHLDAGHMPYNENNVNGVAV